MKYDAMFNLNFDDIHPESSTIGTDCGGDKEKGVFKYFKKIWKIYPDVKITLFITANWIDRANIRGLTYYLNRILGRKYTKKWELDTFRIDKFTGWCKWLNRFENFETANHGLYHHREINPHSAEFQDMSYEECLFRLKESEKIFENSGLKHVKGFRAPGWGISDGLFEALKGLNYDFIACSADTTTKISKHARSNGAGIKNAPLIYPSYHKGLINIPQNWDIMKSDVKRALEIVKCNGLISAKGHIAHVYDRELTGNGLNQESFENIMALLEELENYNIEYLTMKEIANKYKRT